MRKINILNKNYEKIGLDTVVYKNKTIDEVVYIDSDKKEYKYSDIVGGDYNDKVKNATGWSYSLVGNTDRFSIDLLSLLDYIPVDVSEIADVRMKIKGIEFEVKPVALINVLDEYAVGTRYSDGMLYIGLPTSLGLTSTALLEAWLQVNEVEFIFLKSTFSAISEPSQLKYDTWIDVFRARYKITKETVTLREFAAMNIMPSGRFEDTNQWYGHDFDNLVARDNELTVDISNLDAGANLYKYVSNQVMNKVDKYFLMAEIFPLYENDTYIYFRGDNYPVQAVEKNKWNLFNLVSNVEYAADGTFRFFHATDTNYALDDNVKFREIFIINFNNFDEFMTEEHMKYIMDLYREQAYDIIASDKVFDKTAKTKFDVAYTNKTIDEVVWEGLTLRDIFGGGATRYQGINNNLLDGNFEFDENTNGISDFWGSYSTTPNDYDMIDNTQQWDYANVSGSTKGLGIVSLDILERNDKNGDLVYATLIAKHNPAHTGSKYLILGIRTYDGTTAKGNNTFALDLTEEYQKLVFFANTTFDGDNFRMMTYITVDDGLTQDITVKEAKLYNISKMFFGKTIPTQLEFEALLDKWNARKDLKQQLTFEDIFEIDLAVNGYYSSNSPDYLVETEYPYFNILGGGSYPYIIWNKTSQDMIDKYWIGVRVPLEGDGPQLRFALATTGTFPIDSSLIKGANLSYEVTFTELVKNIYMQITDTGGVWGDILNGMVLPVRFSMFDERITKEQIDVMFITYKLIKNNIKVPEVFVITEPTGFGTQHEVLSVDDYDYDYELNYEDISFKINFGINYHAYRGYKLLMNMIQDNECIISYDYGDGIRYADVRLKKAPKTEKEGHGLIVSKFVFKRRNPFYTLGKLYSVDTGTADGANTVDNPIENTHAKKLELTIEIVITGFSALIYSNVSGRGLGFSIDLFDQPDYPQTVIVNSEKKTIIEQEDLESVYDWLNLNYTNFMVVNQGESIVLREFGGVSGAVTSYKISWQQWVVD